MSATLVFQGERHECVSYVAARKKARELFAPWMEAGDRVTGWDHAEGGGVLGVSSEGQTLDWPLARVFWVAQS